MLKTKRFYFIFFLPFLFFLNAERVCAAQLLKIVSLNFNSEVVLDDLSRQSIRDLRFTSMLKWIKQCDPDIVFIIEAWNHHGYASVIDELGISANYDYYSFNGMGVTPIFLDGSGILVKKKFHLDQTGELKLPHSGLVLTNGRHGVLSLSAASWAVGGRLTLDDGTHVYAYATHLIASAETDRADDMIAVNQLIENQMKRNGENWKTARGIISGDFNSSPSTPGIQAFVASGYQDTYGVAHPGQPGFTMCSDPNLRDFNPLTIGAGLFPVQDVIQNNLRIDYIFTKGTDVQVLASHRTFTKPIDDLWMSDHYGLTSTITFGGAPSNSPLSDNSEQDRPDPGILSAQVHVSDKNFTCDSEGCIHLMTDQIVSAERGITFFNETKHKIKIKIQGDGNIWPKNSVTLSPGKVNAFFFEPNHQYQFIVSHWFTRKKLISDFKSGKQ